MSDIKTFIEESLVNYVSQYKADKYGQIKTLDVYSVFKERTKECIEYINQTGIIVLKTYGYAYGTYLGIGSIHSDIVDAELLKKCKEAWKNNASRIKNSLEWY